MQEEKEELILEQAETDSPKREKVSYTKLSTFLQCPYKFQKIYEEKKRSSKSTLALDLGTLCHKGLEIAGNKLIDGEPVPLEYIIDSTYKGYIEGKELIHGVNELQRLYFEDWITPDTKSGLSYVQKMDNFKKALDDLTLFDRGWRVLATEHEFYLPISDKVALFGYIDRIDQRISDGALRLVDYKTSKKLFSDQDIRTPLQMVFYALAIENEFGARPLEYYYHFVLLDKKQYVLSQGFVDRGKKKILKTLDEIEKCRQDNIFKPKPSPLCHWCDFCKTNPQADPALRHECPYHSLWTPNNKTYAVNCAWSDDKKLENTGSTFWF